MKISAGNAAAWFAKPDSKGPGVLIYGNDAMRVALRRQETVSKLAGPGAEEEMRLTRIEGGELRGDPAALLDAVKAQGFFPGHRVIHVEGATDQVLPALAAVLEDWSEGDAQVVVTAGALKPTSKMRKLFEGHRGAYAIGVYDSPPDRAELERMVSEAGVALSSEGQGALRGLALEIEPGDLRQTITKLSLYMRGESLPAEPEDLMAVATLSNEAATDDLVGVVADGDSDKVSSLMRRLEAQGVTATELAITALRHFRTLHAAASHPQGAATGLQRGRPPVYGPRADRMARQAGTWGMAGLEKGIAALLDTDLQLRGTGATVPGLALMERVMIRLAMMGRRR